MINAFSGLECALYNGECMPTDSDMGVPLFAFEQYGASHSLSDKSASYLCHAVFCHMLKRVPGSVLLHIPFGGNKNSEVRKTCTLFCVKIYGRNDSCFCSCLSPFVYRLVTIPVPCGKGQCYRSARLAKQAYPDMAIFGIYAALWQEPFSKAPALQ